MQYLLLALLLIRPFISSLAYPWANSVYSFALIALLLLWIIRNNPPFERFKGLFFPLISFFLALAISSYFSINRVKSASELYKYLSAILLILILPGLTGKTRKNYIAGILTCGIVISIAALYQYFIGFSHLRNFINTQKITDPFVLDYLRQKRVFFPFVTPGLLAGYLAMVGPLVLLYKKRVWLSIPILCALFLTKSLGAFISLFLAGLVYASLRKGFKKTRAILLLGLALFIPLVFFMRDASGKGHLSPLFSIFMRINYWRDTVGIIKMHPFLGVGLGNFNLAYSRYAHNSFLQFWAEAGLFAITSLFWLIHRIMINSINQVKNLSDDKETLVLLTCLATFIFQNLWDFSFFLPEVSLIWWAILGLLPKPKT
ncbi:MAG: O-antigen ligase family protein [Candidatus Omnitrophica bacterium]|nr:O-antigen ligase family protein [Candidatus Omnitrophota bacterium]